MSAGRPAASDRCASGAAAGPVAGGRAERLQTTAAGDRLDVFLARALPDLSRSQAQRLIADGRVLVDGRRERAAVRLDAGNTIDVEVPPPAPSGLTPEEMALDAVYEDADVLVIDKPSGMVVHPSAGHATGTLVHGLLARCGDLSGIGGELRPGIVHRLDRDTSGLLLVAKNDRAHAALTAQFQRRTIEKIYLALLTGTPRPERGIVDAPIGRHPTDRQRMAVREGGRSARTRYAVVAEAGGFALVVVALETGRTHQIRVHFAALGCPVAGDPIYGESGGPAGRLWLHAWRVAFDRPSDGVRLQLEAPLPLELEQSWQPLVADDSAPLPRILQRARRWANRQGKSPHVTEAET